MGKILSTYLSPHPPIAINEIGEGQERKIQKTLDALKKVATQIKQKSPDTIIVITPHGPIFSDAIAIGYNEILKGDMKAFECPVVNFKKKNNISLVDDIVWKAIENEIYCVKLDSREAREYGVSTDLDHGVQVPLYFIDKEYERYKLIHITYGMLSPEELYRFGMVIQEVVEGSEEEVIIIASGDLSHKLKEDGPYGYISEGPEFDSKIVKAIQNNSYEDVLLMDKTLSEKAGECGLRSLYIMLGSLAGYEVKSELISYEDTFGVGYAVAKFELKEKSNSNQLINKIHRKIKSEIENIRKKEDCYVKLARETLETYIKEERIIDISANIPDELINEKAGVFVSIKKDGNLRGCIGTISPTTESVAKEIINNAISAGINDPRFSPVVENELDKLIYSVDVLGKAEVINSLEELDETRYGVIVSSNGKRGLLLPNLEGVDSVKQQINIALSKADIAKDEDYTIERFQVIRHK